MSNSFHPIGNGHHRAGSTGFRTEKVYILLIDDNFTKWAECEALASIKKKSVETFVWKNIICRFGVPKVIITDYGRQFDNESFHNFCSRYGIELWSSSLGFPQSNGQTEVTNWSVLTNLTKEVEDRVKTFAEEIPKVLMAYRTIYRNPIGETPFRLTYGTEGLTPDRDSTRHLSHRTVWGEC